MQSCSYVPTISAIHCETVEKLAKSCVFGPMMENKRVPGPKIKITSHMLQSIALIARWLVKLIPFSDFGYLKPSGYTNEENL